MPNLVGTGLNQVPTNGMLGGLAYQSPDHASIKDLDLKNLSQINSEIADTARDIFIYDTSKDSDGGAWRHRTSHLSWYNETLNTATRGSRREFPAVAVIVVTAATTRKLYIYDGDDPDLPMWMVIDTTDGQWPQTEFSSLYALNGIIALGSASDTQPLYETRNRLDLYYFVSDKIISSGDGAGNNYYGIVEGIVNRRTHASNRGTSIGETVYQLVNHSVNDVAMTVLPNAPIDDATGLPIPTIAVATDGGVSVIKDDGTVVNYTRGGNEYTGSVAFDQLNDLIISWGTSLGGYRHATRITNPFVGSTSLDTTYGYIASDLGMGGSAAGNTGGVVTVANSGRHFGIDFDSSSGVPSAQNNHDDRVNFLHINDADTTKSLVAYATTSYNTGWMHGDIKGAFLSDTDATNVTATSDNLIINGGFADASNWNVASGWTISGGVATNNGTGGTNQLSQAVSMDAGKQYILNYEVTAYTSGTLQAYFNGTWTTVPGTVGTHGVSFTASASVQQIYFAGISGTSWTGSLDNVSLSLAGELDRSVKGKGLAVYGTITKSAVATGAELVAYSGFSASNYLEQPHHTGLEVGTGDFYVMGWFKGDDSTYNSPFEISSPNVDTNGVGSILLLVGPHTNNGLRFYTRNNSSGGWNQNNNGVPFIDDNSTWNFVCCLRRSGVKYIYMNGGAEVNAGTHSDNLTETDSIMRLGTRSDTLPSSGASPWTGSLSLWRFGQGAPSAEQIKKIYEDEKVLFQENANATLYGSSDTVTALAYDEVTERLHVGTSSGRSEFQGLRRINNTTTAVTTAISAYDSFVVEQ